MTDQHDDDIDAAFQADMDRLKAQVGAAALAEAQRLGVGDQMMTDALIRAIAANDAPPDGMWSRPAEEGWQ